MVSYLQIEEYVARCQRAMEKNTPLEKIETLVRIKKLMREDLVRFWTNTKASDNSIRWWWYAVDYVHDDLFGYILMCESWGKPIELDNFMEWVEFLGDYYTLFEGLDSDHGPGREYDDYDESGNPVTIMLFPEKYVELNDQYPLRPTERKPIVTMLDVAFRELLWVWTRVVRRLLRDAVVDGLVENTEEAEPPEYMTDNFFIDNLKMYQILAN